MQDSYSRAISKFASQIFYYRSWFLILITFVQKICSSNFGEIETWPNVELEFSDKFHEIGSWLYEGCGRLIWWSTKSQFKQGPLFWTKVTKTLDNFAARELFFLKTKWSSFLLRSLLKNVAPVDSNSSFLSSLNSITLRKIEIAHVL